MLPRFDLQGHRGARGLRPENTLPAFETAFDLGVTTVETDVHLTRDSVPILYHDPAISERLCRRTPDSGAAEPSSNPLVSSLALAELRRYRADRNPHPSRFPHQDSSVTPAAALFAERQGIDPYAPPALADLFAFAEAYAGELGVRAGKSDAQRERARRIRFNLELKRVPFDPNAIGDRFDGDEAGLLEQGVVEVVRAAGVVGRTAVCSFDHRSLRALRRLEPALTTTVLVSNTAPVAPDDLVRRADAQGYGPDYRFLDAAQVRQVQAEGYRVVPWTVNEPEELERLLDWDVDGVATDFPERMAAVLRRRGIAF